MWQPYWPMIYAKHSARQQGVGTEGSRWNDIVATSLWMCYWVLVVPPDILSTCIYCLHRIPNQGCMWVWVYHQSLLRRGTCSFSLNTLFPLVLFLWLYMYFLPSLWQKTCVFCFRTRRHSTKDSFHLILFLSRYGVRLSVNCLEFSVNCQDY